MGRKKKDKKEEVSFKDVNISDVSGAVNLAGRDISVTQVTTGLSSNEIGRLFAQLYTAIESRSGSSQADKADLKTDVHEIQAVVTQAVEKNEKVEESFLSRRFRNIARVAPDILDVIVATLASPLAGLGVAVKKIAEKARGDVTQSH